MLMADHCRPRRGPRGPPVINVPHDRRSEGMSAAWIAGFGAFGLISPTRSAPDRIVGPLRHCRYFPRGLRATEIGRARARHWTRFPHSRASIAAETTDRKRRPQIPRPGDVSEATPTADPGILEGVIGSEA
jgi:2-keto-3-deoxy-L-rhamnonate aldolase RhmA